MLSLVAVALAAAIIVVYALPRGAPFGHHLALGSALGAAGALLVLALSIAIVGGSWGWPALLRGAGIVAALGAVLGAAGGSAAWVAGRLSVFAGLFRPRPGFDPEGEGLARDAAEATRRGRLRAARVRAESELADGRVDPDLWQQAAAETGSQAERRRQRYIELRAERMVLG